MSTTAAAPPPSTARACSSAISGDTVAGLSNWSRSIGITLNRLRPRSAPTKSATNGDAGRPTVVTVGRLEITGLAHDREQGDDILVFDPTRITDGIELSDDAILRFRTRAYSESVLRRTGVSRDA